MEILITLLLKEKVRKVGYQNMGDILKGWTLKGILMLLLTELDLAKYADDATL